MSAGRLEPVLGNLGPILGRWQAQCSSTGMQFRTIRCRVGGQFWSRNRGRGRGLFWTQSRSLFHATGKPGRSL